MGCACGEPNEMSFFHSFIHNFLTKGTLNKVAYAPYRNGAVRPFFRLVILTTFFPAPGNHVSKKMTSLKNVLTAPHKPLNFGSLW